ncbi:HD domain-containing protein [Crossiella sp. CA-258035]|uniref:HD domain-containing protein n=1 Tax=Crossiella sp. CA-258035 TaxID=2981138 RepID=UPI0024BD47C0|nr:HD domain-containing protein [Crossiella sp. CA-258035]WHT22307.1 HD domain-containing protein [Crossiella sp. CA-258035]
MPATLTVPDSALAAEATELVRDLTDDLLYHHSRRVYHFGALRGEHRGLTFDRELLYVGAMFHDLGLTERHRQSRQRFEIDGADDAAEFLRRHGLPEQAVTTVWTAIALHTTMEVPHHMAPEIALVIAGVEVDVVGVGLDEVREADRAAVVALHPRPEFKRRILEAFHRGLAHRPETTFGNIKADVLARYEPGFRRTDFVDVILESSWAE